MLVVLIGGEGGCGLLCEVLVVCGVELCEVYVYWWVVLWLDWWYVEFLLYVLLLDVCVLLFSVEVIGYLC